MTEPDSNLRPLTVCSEGLGRVLLRLGLVAPDELERLVKDGGNRKLLARLGGQSHPERERAALRAIADDLGLEVVDAAVLQRVSSTAKSLLNGIDRNLLLLHRAVPVRLLDADVVVALADPLDREAVAALEFVFQRSIRVACAREADIIGAIQRIAFESANDVGNLSVLERPDTEDASVEGTLEQGSHAAPVVKLVNELLKEGVRLRASDVHLEPSEKEFEVRFRIDGVLTPYSSMSRHLQLYVTARIKLLAGMDLAEKRRPQDGRFRVRISADEVRDLRVSSVPTPLGEKIVIRILRGDNEGVALEQLGMPIDVEEAFIRTLSATDRLVVVTGPTGSGKTTSLYGALHRLRQGRTNLVTVEDPIEFRLPGITQIQVDSKLGVTFASALRSILRQDPDVIMVGEIRDRETAEIACQAAQTGHLVVSTLHTNSAPAALVRLLDLGVEATTLASSLGAILAQRLVRRPCACSSSVSIERRTELEKRFHRDFPSVRLAVGCQDCFQTGYSGRIGVYSLLEVDDAVASLMKSRKSEADISSVAQASGFRSLADRGLDLVAQGLTTYEELERVVGAVELARFADRIGRQAAPAPVRPTSPDFEDKELNTSIHSLTGSPGHGSQTKRLVLLDDDPQVLDVLVRVLKREGFEVYPFEDAEPALRFLSSDVCDLIVCDLMMPRMSGLEFASRAKSISATPLIILTASDSDQNEVRLLSAGADDFVSKTSSPSVLVTRIKRLLRAL